MFKKLKFKKERKKKRKTPQNCKSPMQRQRCIATIKSVTEYTHTHIHIYPSAKLKQSNKNKIQQIDPANKGNKKNYVYQLRRKLTKAQTGKQN